MKINTHFTKEKRGGWRRNLWKRVQREGVKRNEKNMCCRQNNNNKLDWITLNPSIEHRCRDSLNWCASVCGKWSQWNYILYVFSQPLAFVIEFYIYYTHIVMTDYQWTIQAIFLSISHLFIASGFIAHWFLWCDETRR